MASSVLLMTGSNEEALLHALYERAGEPMWCLVSWRKLKKKIIPYYHNTGMSSMQMEKTGDLYIEVDLIPTKTSVNCSHTFCTITKQMLIRDTTGNT